MLNHFLFEKEVKITRNFQVKINHRETKKKSSRKLISSFIQLGKHVNTTMERKFSIKRFSSMGVKMIFDPHQPLSNRYTQF